MPPPMNNPLMALLQQGGQMQQPQLPQVPPMPPQGMGMPQGPPQGMPPQAMPQGMPQGPPQGMNPAQAQPGNIPNLGVMSGMGGNLSNELAKVGATAPQPPIHPVVDIYDNTPPIVREAIRRRLFTQGM